MRYVITITLLVGLLAGCAPQRHATTTPPAKRPEPAPSWVTVGLTKEQEQVAMARIRDLLKDPESARFSELYGAKPLFNKDAEPAVCGFVNAKNSYGGYVGKKRFFTAGNITAMWDDRPKYGFSSDNEMIKDACIRR